MWWEKVFPIVARSGGVSRMPGDTVGAYLPRGAEIARKENAAAVGYWAAVEEGGVSSPGALSPGALSPGAGLQPTNVPRLNTTRQTRTKTLRIIEIPFNW